MAKNKNSLSDEKIKSAAGGVKPREDGRHSFDEELDDQVSRTKKRGSNDSGKGKRFWSGYELGYSIDWQ